MTIAIVTGLSLYSFIELPLQNFSDPETMGSLVFGTIASLIVGALVFRLFWFPYSVQKQRYFWEQTSIGLARFQLPITTWPYFKLKLGNLLLVACTLGLAWPWTTIRNIRFVTDRLTLVGIDNFDEIVQAYDEAPPMGEGLDGFLDTGFDLVNHPWPHSGKGIISTVETRPDSRHDPAYATTLHIMKGDGHTIHWHYSEIVQTQGAYKGEPVRLEYGSPLPQTVIIEDATILTAIQDVTASQATHLHNPQKRHVRLRMTILAGIALLGVTAGFYVWGIPGLATFLDPRIPVSWEQQLGVSVLEHLAPSTDRCVDQNRLPVIESIVTRLSRAMPDSPYRIRLTIVDRPAINAFALPGGQVVLFRGLLEAAETPEQLAGVLAHELQHIYKTSSEIADMTPRHA